MMRGVLFECHALRALRCVCVALRCVALRCVVLRCVVMMNLLWREGLYHLHHHGPITTVQASFTVTWLLKGHAQGSKLTKYCCSRATSMQDINPHCLSFEYPCMSTTLIVYCSCQHQPYRKNSMEVILKSYIVYCFHPFPPCICSMWSKTPTLHHFHTINININININTFSSVYWLFHCSKYPKQNAYIPQPAASPGTWCWFHYVVYHQHCSLSSIFKCLKVCTLHLLGLSLSSFSPPAPLLLADRLHRPQRGTVGSLRKLQADSFHAMENGTDLYLQSSLYNFLLTVRERERVGGGGEISLHYCCPFLSWCDSFTVCFVVYSFSFLSLTNTDWSNADNFESILSLPEPHEPHCWGLGDPIESSHHRCSIWQPGRCHLCSVEIYPYFSCSFLSSLILPSCLFQYCECTLI